MDGRGETKIGTRSTIRLNDKQQAVLAWIVQDCPPGVYPDDDFSHRVSARALKNRGLIHLSGHGKSWRATPTERGRVWPTATEEDDRERARQARADPKIVATAQGSARVESGALGRALQRMPRKDPAKPKKQLPIRQVNKQERYMRYKVVVTRVQVAEKWVRATDEEDAARKVQEEFAKPYSALYELTNRGDIEYTRIGSRKYIPRESLMHFIATNTHRGYSPS